MSTLQPEKKSVRVHFVLFWILALCALLYYGHILTQPASPFQPRSESYAPYERHYHFGWRFPFITTYFLLLPQDYDKHEEYPLVMMLHGVSRHMDGGKDLMQPEMREKYPFIVLIPIAPPLFRWADPLESGLMPEALPIAMDVLDSVHQTYSVDRDKIYITGYSMGGEGTYGALCRYHDIFAAAAPLDAAWIPEQAEKIDDIPIWIFQGEEDRFSKLGKKMAEEIALQGHDVGFTEYTGMGHGAWTVAYKNEKFWDWLIDQEK